MHGPINIKSPNNTSKWQMGFNSAFKGLIGLGSFQVLRSSYRVLYDVKSRPFSLMKHNGRTNISGGLFESRVVGSVKAQSTQTDGRTVVCCSEWCTQSAWSWTASSNRTLGLLPFPGAMNRSSATSKKRDTVEGLEVLQSPIALWVRSNLGQTFWASVHSKDNELVTMLTSERGYTSKEYFTQNNVIIAKSFFVGGGGGGLSL
jgi:hypothetical protein